MERKSFKTADQKLQVVLSVLRGGMTQVEAARRLQMSQPTIAKWQKQILEGGRTSPWPVGRTPRGAQPQGSRHDSTRREAGLRP